MNQQQQKYRTREDSLGEVNAFYWYQIFTHDSVVIKI